MLALNPWSTATRRAGAAGGDASTGAAWANRARRLSCERRSLARGEARSDAPTHLRLALAAKRGCCHRPTTRAASAPGLPPPKPAPPARPSGMRDHMRDHIGVGAPSSRLGAKRVKQWRIHKSSRNPNFSPGCTRARARLPTPPSHAPRRWRRYARYIRHSHVSSNFLQLVLPYERERVARYAIRDQWANTRTGRFGREVGSWLTISDRRRSLATSSSTDWAGQRLFDARGAWAAARSQNPQRSPGLPYPSPAPACGPPPSRTPPGRPALPAAPARFPFLPGTVCAQCRRRRPAARGAAQARQGNPRFAGAPFPLPRRYQAPEHVRRGEGAGVGGWNETEKKFGRIRPASPVRALALALRWCPCPLACDSPSPTSAPTVY